jgi:hydrogenase maturation factor
MGDILPLGKLTPRLLKDLLSRHGIKNDRVKVGPHFGEDAAAIDLGDRYLLLASDPITFTPERIGWYAVHVNANDIAAMGGTPQYFLATVLLPEDGATADTVDRIFADVAEACREVGCTPVGGHTEITYGLDRPIVSGAIVGEAAKDQLVTSSGAEPGDMLIVTRGIAIEATAILGREKADEIVAAFGEDFQETAAHFIEDPGISVVAASRAACREGKVHALHDPTEGGIANALWELAEASDVGLIVVESEIPLYWESTRLAELFDINLLGAIASGALLIAASESDTSGILDNLSEAEINAQVIGRVVEKKQGVKLMRGEQRTDLPRFDADEITRML